jgi:hypothetical protein
LIRESERHFDSLNHFVKLEPIRPFLASKKGLSAVRQRKAEVPKKGGTFTRISESCADRRETVPREEREGFTGFETKYGVVEL